MGGGGRGRKFCVMFISVSVEIEYTRSNGMTLFPIDVVYLVLPVMRRKMYVHWRNRWDDLVQHHPVTVIKEGVVQSTTQLFHSMRVGEDSKFSLEEGCPQISHVGGCAAIEKLRYTARNPRLEGLRYLSSRARTCRK